MVGEFIISNSLLGKIQELLILSILVLRVITNTVIITTGDVAPAQAEEPVIDTSAKDIPVEASAKKAITMKPDLEVVIQEAIAVSNPKAPMVISEIRKRLNQLAPIIWDGTSVPTLVSERTSVMIIETGSGSVLLVPTPAMDILE